MTTDEQKFKNCDIVSFYDEKTSTGYFGRILNHKPDYCHNEKTGKYEWKYKVGVSFPGMSDRFESELNPVDLKIFTDEFYNVDLNGRGGIIIRKGNQFFSVSDRWIITRSKNETPVEPEIFDAINNLYKMLEGKSNYQK